MKYLLILIVTVISTDSFADIWKKGSMNDPSFFSIENYHFDSLNAKAHLLTVPHVSVHWLHKEGGISWRYKNEVKKYTPVKKIEKLKGVNLAHLSPSEKYDLARSDYNYSLTHQEKVSSKNHKYEWEGHCHGWTVAALKYELPSRDIIITNKEGLKIPFSPQDTLALLSYFEGSYQTPWDYWVIDHKLPFYLTKNSKKLEKKRILELLYTIHDATLMNSLVTFYLSHSIDDFSKKLLDEAKKYKFKFYSPYLGVKNVSKDKLQHDDLNPGALHLVLTNVLGSKNKNNRRGLIADTDPYKPVWNRPLYGYESKVLSRKKTKTGEKLEVKMNVFYVHELAVPKAGKIKSKKSVKAKVMNYFIDLDKKGNIVGGEWKKSSDRFDFVWTPFYSTRKDFEKQKFYSSSIFKKLLNEN